jgi:uncharacterized protein DUF3465
VILRAVVLAAVLASACGATLTGNAGVERAFADHASGVEVTAQGAVTRVLADDTGPSGTHQRFIMQMSGSTQTLLIDNNVDIGKRVPVASGDAVVVHGEYVWNDQGGLIHFTHHDPQHTHEDGWIEAKGVRYS